MKGLHRHPYTMQPLLMRSSKQYACDQLLLLNFFLLSVVIVIFPSIMAGDSPPWKQVCLEDSFPSFNLNIEGLEDFGTTFGSLPSYFQDDHVHNWFSPDPCGASGRRNIRDEDREEFDVEVEFDEDGELGEEFENLEQVLDGGACDGREVTDACEGIAVSKSHSELVLKQKKLSDRFGEINPEEVRNVDAGGRRRSKATEIWARNAFDDWRVFRGLDTQLSIEDMFE